MSAINQGPHSDFGGVVSNAFGEHYLFSINRNAFQNSDASTVFRSRFGDSLFQDNTFYVIAGTDSGLLYQYIKAHGVPTGSRYLFVELPQVLDLLVELNDPNGELVITTPDEWLQRGAKMDIFDYALQDRLVLERSLGVVHGHCSDYPPFWRKLKHEFDDFIRQQRVGINSRPFTLRQIENLTENQVPAICLRDSFRGKTAVVLAGGPSLDELLPWIRRHRNNLLVIAVSRVSHSLLQAQIQPDICVSVDPYPIMLKVSREMLEFQDGTVLVNEYHLSSNLLSSWGGQKAFMGPRYPWTTPQEVENLAPSIGATVTNTAFALALEMGVSQLVLGGADFCFNQAGYTHASGSEEHSAGPRPMYADTRVETNGGKMADTTNPYLNSARTIDRQAADAFNRNCRVINPSPNSMRLPNVEYVSMDSIHVEPLATPARQILAAKLSPSDKTARGKLYQETLSEVDRVLDELRAIKGLSRKALDYNRKLFDKTGPGAGFHNNAKLDSIERQFDSKYASTVKFVKKFGIRRLIPILRHKEEHEADLQENSRLYFQAFVDTTNELIDILQQARSRILSRIEEDKPQPDIERLLEQWCRDEQAGRAIQWAQGHADHIAQLPEAQRQMLKAFEATFEDSIEKLSKDNIKRIEDEGITLDGLNSRAREYFLCHDIEGLNSLMAGLKEHRDQAQAKHYIPLVQGYLAELADDAKTAIETYETIAEGNTRVDGLMRLFELHTRAQNMESALAVLKELSVISPIYTPMYADMLQGTGDVQQAVEIYTDYLLENPDDLNSVMKLGQIYHQHGATDGVVWAMNYILAKDPSNHAAMAMLKSLDQSQVNGK
ncbi:hypothetical protein Tel_05575 [Candidatus Tenderia electrophaga]|uniref:6-hydroxymethylpterin diphosphokinase MptE-like domain-containing protein n=1 Tax=Candidatus Tenderia electrophaga TaxID=1748243 RepID=A0A0S2TC35_9GAMM|nr:hypothetical protein Tel_05575 [Candidatus Tenderia electrophaga]